MAEILKSFKRSLSGNHEDGEEIDTFESTPRRKSSLFGRKSAIEEYAAFDEGKPAEEYHERRRSGSFSKTEKYQRSSIETPSDMPVESLEERRRSSVEYSSTVKYPPTPTSIVHLMYPPNSDSSGFGFILKRIKGGIFVSCAMMGSPAAECGVSFGDEIVSVEKRSLGGIKAKKAAEILREFLAKQRGESIEGSASNSRSRSGSTTSQGDWGARRSGSIGNQGELRRGSSFSMQREPSVGENGKPFLELGIRRNPLEMVHEIKYQHEPLGIRFAGGRILDVKKGSPAERAGVKPLRFMTAIDGRVIVGLHDRDVFDRIKLGSGSGTLTLRTMSSKKYIKLTRKINRSNLRFGLDHSANEEDLRRRASFDEQLKERQIQQALKEIKLSSLEKAESLSYDDPSAGTGYEL